MTKKALVVVVVVVQWLSHVQVFELSKPSPMNCSPPGSSVHGIFQARILEWGAIAFSGDLLNPGIEPGSPALQADSSLSEPPGKPQVHMSLFLLAVQMNS